MSSMRIFILSLAMLSFLLPRALAQDTRPALPEPTLVSLKLDNVAPEAALDELSRQTGYPLTPLDERQWKTWASTAPMISVSLDKVPFWAALREVCSKSGLTAHGGGYGSGGTARGITLIPQREGAGNYMNCPVSLSGPFMVIANGINRSSYADLSRPQAAQRTMSVQMLAFFEPKLKVVRFGYVPDLEEATDEKGNSLLPNNPARGQPVRQVMITMPRGAVSNIYATLGWPREMGEKIARLKGTLRVGIQTRSDTLDVPDVMKAGDVRKMLGSVEVTFKRLSKLNERQWQAEISIAKQGELDQKTLSEFMSNFSARLTDEQEGREYIYYGGGAWQAMPADPRGGAVRVGVVPALANPYDMKLSFYYTGQDKVVGEPTRLTLELTTETQELAVPFEFRNVAVP